jgi:hypothetical protein
MTESGKGRHFQRVGQYGHHPRGLHISPPGGKETEDPYGPLNSATAKVSVGSEHCYSSPAPQ